MFVLDGQEYNSSEQFIQATKAEYFGDNIARERILRCDDAMDSKEISMDITNFNKCEWSRVAEELCYPGIKAKFFQNPGLMAALLNTGTKKLVESSFNDLWGTGIPIWRPDALDETKWKSSGILGKILMHVRAEKCDIISGNDDMDDNVSSVSTNVETN